MLTDESIDKRILLFKAIREDEGRSLSERSIALCEERLLTRERIIREVDKKEAESTIP